MIILDVKLSDDWSCLRKIIADLTDQKIEWLYAGKTLFLAEERDSYQKKELRHFLNIMSGRISSDNNVEEACRVLRIVGGKA